MTSSVSFPLLENGLDYMESAVGHLSGSPTDRDLKYGVLHLAAAIEVLLKMRLAGEHWALIFEQSGSASMDKFTRRPLSKASSKLGRCSIAA
jgi:hypothetical protein